MNTSRQSLLLQAPVGQALFRLSWPTWVGIVVIMFFSLVDSFFVAMLGTRELAALSFTFPVSFMLMNIIMGISIGLSVVIARLLGRGKQAAAARTTTHTLWITTLAATLLALICAMLLTPVFRLLGADESLLPLIKPFMLVWLAGVVFLVVPMVGNGAIRATGDTLSASGIMVWSGLANAVLDPLFIFGLGPFPQLGLLGAAVATALAWGSAFVLALWILRRNKRLLGWPAGGNESVLATVKPVMHIGVPSALSNLLVPLASGVITALVAVYGHDAVAAFGIGTRVEVLVIATIMAVCAAVPPFIGQNIAAQEYQRIRDMINKSIKFNFWFFILAYLVLFFSAGYIADLFTEDPAVRSGVMLFLGIVPLAYSLQGLQLLIAAILNAFHRPMTAFFLNLTRLFLTYVPLCYLGSLWFDLPGLYGGGVLASLFSASLAVFFLKKTVQQNLPAATTFNN